MAAASYRSERWSAECRLRSLSTTTHRVRRRRTTSWESRRRARPGRQCDRLETGIVQTGWRDIRYAGRGAAVVDGSRASVAGSVVMPEGRVEACDQAWAVERLGQKADCSGLHRSREGALLWKGRDEDEWHVLPAGKQVGLQFDTTHGRHADIGNHTRRVVQAVGLQELLGRPKRKDGVSMRSYKAARRRAHRCIVVNNRNRGKSFWQ